MHDVDDALGYDADHDDPRQFCAHGTFIGSWWGPDYLCVSCEMGISVVEHHLHHLVRVVRNAEGQPALGLCVFADKLHAGEIDIPFRASVAQAVCQQIWADSDEIRHQLRRVRRCKARLRHYRWVHRAELTEEVPS